MLFFSPASFLEYAWTIHNPPPRPAWGDGLLCTTTLPAQEAAMAQVNTRTPVRYPAWQREYEAAAFEDDPQKLHVLVSGAQAAIARRLQSLAIESWDERQAMNNAITFLRLLERQQTHA
jgi:hypothetical protein